ncbi:hypothetical protein JZ751_005863 [Albula glossodonta]|uniref:Uncharacterized protein n=1 Tax=Albula glossodonta TaxID=121402 RepID=A0A8T2P5I0_9TELE|nr:hypothetical protein JZ751_005863 [Albula glossodonta]
MLVLYSPHTAFSFPPFPTQGSGIGEQCQCHPDYSIHPPGQTVQPGSVGRPCDRKHTLTDVSLQALSLCKHYWTRCLDVIQRYTHLGWEPSQHHSTARSTHCPHLTGTVHSIWRAVVHLSQQDYVEVKEERSQHLTPTPSPVIKNATRNLNVCELWRGLEGKVWTFRAGRGRAAAQCAQTIHVRNDTCILGVETNQRSLYGPVALENDGHEWMKAWSLR